MKEKQIEYVPIDQVVRDPNQPRRDFDEQDIALLADAVARDGIHTPMRVWSTSDGLYSLIGGERRLRAGKKAGLTHVPVIIEDKLVSVGELQLEQLADNMLHSPLCGLDIAEAAKSVMSLLNITAQEVAVRLCVTSSRLSMAMRLLELPAPVRAMVRTGELKENVGYHIARLKDDPAGQLELAEKSRDKKITRDGVAEEVNDRLGHHRATKPKLSRLACKLNGVSVTVTAARPLTKDDLVKVSDQLRKEAKKLPESNGEYVTLAGSLGAS